MTKAAQKLSAKNTALGNMKKQSKSARIESALKELKNRRIIDWWAKFESRHDTWEIGFPTNSKYKGISLLDFSAREVDFNFIMKRENDLTAIIAAVSLSLHKVNAATYEKLDDFYDKVENK